MIDSIFVIFAKYLFIVPVIALGWYFFVQPKNVWLKNGIFAIISLAFTYGIGKIAGMLYFDPRPFVVGHFTPLIAHAADNGFPSDHALLVAGIAMVGTMWNKKLGGALWILALLVMAGRVYVGVHHPIDVIGSAIIAIIATDAVYVAMKSKAVPPASHQ
ncbi:MAG TPA: phosphatase PAP2 family protein [Candidatus Paceibacterota bacterium]|nr:phosphatase PAP2 family protein [Candidatus Paceibacterota bacterium]